ncbi:non-homologous end-joining DNA ligase [Actinoplanes sp. NPDC049596]|uniref:non-homologous end-joining DNA ligase n=1 Tax=unclassified Actinoplanes TaxID=2626549 RepID=UPI003429D0C8
MKIDGELVRPMLAALGPLPAGPGWAFEFKYDGVRAVTYADGATVRALTRNDNDVTSTYPELAEVAALLRGRPAILDGEIVALEAGERPSFALLQNRMHVAAPPPSLLRVVPIRYYVFDVLELDGESTIDLPYRRRRELLAGLRLDGAVVRTPAGFPDADGATVLDAAKLSGFEGVVAKRQDGVYRAGRRSAEWTKVPLIRTQEVVIIGYEPGEGRRAGTIGSLLLAVPDQDQQLRYAGQVGTGFTDAMLDHLLAQLEPDRRPTAPVPGVPRDHARHARWVEPTLVGEVAFRNWTVDGRLRHASWRGLRPDRRPLIPPPRPKPATPAPEEVTGTVMTADAAWRVEAVRRDGRQWYRIVHGDNVVDGLSLDDVQRVLEKAGIDFADLTEAA